jgi:hypothetical protein
MFGDGDMPWPHVDLKIIAARIRATSCPLRLRLRQRVA